LEHEHPSARKLIGDVSPSIASVYAFFEQVEIALVI
jgi:hypothetical protein